MKLSSKQSYLEPSVAGQAIITRSDNHTRYQLSHDRLNGNKYGLTNNPLNNVSNEHSTQYIDLYAEEASQDNHTSHTINGISSFAVKPVEIQDKSDKMFDKSVKFSTNGKNINVLDADPPYKPSNTSNSDIYTSKSSCIAPTKWLAKSPDDRLIPTQLTRWNTYSPTRNQPHKQFNEEPDSISHHHNRKNDVARDFDENLLVSSSLNKLKRVSTFSSSETNENNKYSRVSSSSNDSYASKRVSNGVDRSLDVQTDNRVEYRQDSMLSIKKRVKVFYAGKIHDETHELLEKCTRFGEIVLNVSFVCLLDYLFTIHSSRLDKALWSGRFYPKK